MARASARRSFHGPLHSAARAPARRSEGPASSRPLELLPPPPSESSLGRAGRAESPAIFERERILAGVLSALQRLTAKR